MEFLPPIMPLFVRASQILRWVWQRPEGLLGLHGLARVIEMHGTSYCFG